MEEFHCLFPKHQILCLANEKGNKTSSEYGSCESFEVLASTEGNIIAKFGNLSIAKLEDRFITLELCDEPQSTMERPRSSVQSWMGSFCDRYFTLLEATINWHG